MRIIMVCINVQYFDVVPLSRTPYVVKVKGLEYIILYISR